MKIENFDWNKLRGVEDFEIDEIELEPIIIEKN
jgi:hypothetical protein